MRASKYLFSLWLGVFIYALLFFVFGARGISAHSQLLLEQEKQEVNMELLKQTNRELEDTMDSLLYDKDTLAVYAREQGYASGRERFIRVVGLGLNNKSRTSAGSVLVAAEPQYIPNETLIIIAFCAGISVFICMAVFDILKALRARS